MTRIIVAFHGEDPAAVDALRGILRAAPDVELARDVSLDEADVVIVLGGGDQSALDRCRALGSAIACIVVLDGRPLVEAVTAAMAAGARGVIGRPWDAFAVLDAVRNAAPFSVGRPGRDIRARVVVVTGARGGCGVSTTAHLIASGAGVPVAGIDLDLSGGTLARLAGVVAAPSVAGLAGEPSGRRAWQRLAVDTPYGRLVPAPHLPELAWLVRAGVARDLVRCAAAEYETVVVDAGRAAGPALEVVGDADVIVVVRTAGADAAEAANAHAAAMERLSGGGARIVRCASALRPYDRVRIASERGGAAPPDVVVPWFRQPSVPAAVRDRVCRTVLEGA